MPKSEYQNVYDALESLGQSMRSRAQVAKHDSKGQALIGIAKMIERARFELEQVEKDFPE